MHESDPKIRRLAVGAAGGPPADGAADGHGLRRRQRFPLLDRGRPAVDQPGLPVRAGRGVVPVPAPGRKPGGHGPVLQRQRDGSFCRDTGPGAWHPYRRVCRQRPGDPDPGGRQNRDGVPAAEQSAQPAADPQRNHPGPDPPGQEREVSRQRPGADGRGRRPHRRRGDQGPGQLHLAGIRQKALPDQVQQKDLRAGYARRQEVDSAGQRLRRQHDPHPAGV